MEGKPCGQKSTREIATVFESVHAGSLHFCSHNGGMTADVLTPQARELFPKLARFRADFYLAGGTALALQINHRVSIDFDLFSDEPIARQLLRLAEGVFAGSDREVMVNNTDELSMNIDGVKFTFLHYPFAPCLPLRDDDPIPALSVKEILATKAYTIGRRGEFKDYVDLYAGLKGGYATLREIIDLARKKYADAFNDRLFLEQLVYLEDVPEAPIIFLEKPVCRPEIEQYFSELISQFRLAA
jgi:predicted nucleotidyltransferase component of viral defense system